MSVRNFLLVAVLSVFVFSCKKKDNEPEASKKELITATWKVSDVLNGTVSVLSLVPDLNCITDNTISFKADGSFVIAEGANICTPKFEGNGTWELVENDAKVKLVFSGDADDVVAPIKELTATSLKIDYYLEEPLPGTYTMVLVKQ